MFEGFSEQTIDFLWGIRFNNQRDWFSQHKDEYLKTLYEPMRALADQVGRQYSLEGTVLKTSRIYRDVRYAHVPYKDYLWFVIREDATLWSEHPSLYFQIQPEGGEYGFIDYAPSAQLMARHRRRMLERPGEFADIMAPILKSGEFQDRSTRYKRPKEGGSPEIDQYYQMKNCYVNAEIPVGPELYAKDLPDRLAAAFRTVEPLYRYFRALERAEE